jgi:hypothetical protein
MRSHSAGPPAEPLHPPPPVRAQLLATEHGGLLAARGTAQGEVLARIGVLLTLVSAGLVRLALIGQVTDVSDAFIALAIGVLALIDVVGLLTQPRVTNIGIQDPMYVVAINPLRAASTELDPGIRRFPWRRRTTTSRACRRRPTSSLRSADSAGSSSSARRCSGCWRRPSRTFSARRFRLPSPRVWESDLSSSR